MIEDRSQGLGGSDAAAALGFDKYRSPYELWLEKTGRAERKPAGLPAEVGTYLEPFVAKKYQEQEELELLEVPKTWQHDRYPFLFAHLDRLAIPAKENWDETDAKKFYQDVVILECKTSSAFLADNWGDEDTGKLPESYLIQVYYYLALTNFKRADVAVLIGNHAFKIYRIERNPDFEQTIIEGMVNFWQEHIVKDVAPDEQSWFDLKYKYQDIRENLREASASEVQLINRYTTLDEQRKKIEKQLDHIKFNLCKAIGDDSGLSDNDKALVTWKEVNAKIPDCPHCHLPLRDKPELPQRRFWVTKYARGLNSE